MAGGGDAGHVLCQESPLCVCRSSNEGATTSLARLYPANRLVQIGPHLEIPHVCVKPEEKHRDHERIDAVSGYLLRKLVFRPGSR